jgi:hypothetical protein
MMMMMVARGGSFASKNTKVAAGLVGFVMLMGKYLGLEASISVPYHHCHLSFSAPSLPSQARTRSTAGSRG